MGIAAAIAGVGLAVGGVGAVVSASSKNKAADKAAAASQYSSDQAAAVTRENYDKSAAALAPWQQGGLQAFDAVNSFLGLSPTQQPQQSLPTQQQQAMAYYGGDYGGFPQSGPNGNGAINVWRGLVNPAYQQQTQQQTPWTQQSVAATGTQPNPQDGFRKYIENSDYGFKFGEGANQVNSGYAGAGTLQSGAAMRALEQYRQNLQQGYRGEYLGALGNQQTLGATAASAQAGVAQNVGNSLATIYQNNGANQANAQLAKTSGLGNALGIVGGGLYGWGAG